MITEAEAARLRARLDKALAQGGCLRTMTPLPRRTRLRLRATRAVNALGCWLCDHGMADTAMLMWQALGMDA